LSKLGTGTVRVHAVSELLVQAFQHFFFNAALVACKSWLRQSN